MKFSVDYRYLFRRKRLCCLQRAKCIDKIANFLQGAKVSARFNRFSLNLRTNYMRYKVLDLKTIHTDELTCEFREAIIPIVKKWTLNIPDTTVDTIATTADRRLPSNRLSVEEIRASSPDCRPVQSTQIIMFTFHGRLHPGQTPNSTRQLCTFSLSALYFAAYFFAHFLCLRRFLFAMCSTYICERDLKLKEETKLNIFAKN